jgi:secernin
MNDDGTPRTAGPNPGWQLRTMAPPWVRPTSCDTFVAVGGLAGSATLLGKNSDRPAFDCQPLRHHAEATHPVGSTIQLEYVSIPQAEHTRATCGSSPYWCWGYEMGMNSSGVAIGNEAIFTKELARTVALHEASAAGRGAPVPLGVSGMAVLRIGLERGATAEAALTAMVAVIEEFGQWGSAVPGADHVAGSYDNSFLIADGTEAWVLETAGKHWVAKRVPSGTTAAISNEPIIRTEWDRCSDGLVEHAVQHGWWAADAAASFDFALAYVDHAAPLQVSHIRLQRSRQLLAEKGDAANVDVAWCKRILRDHLETSFLCGMSMSSYEWSEKRFYFSCEISLKRDVELCS